MELGRSIASSYVRSSSSDQVPDLRAASRMRRGKPSRPTSSGPATGLAIATWYQACMRVRGLTRPGDGHGGGIESGMKRSNRSG